jgi:hypothetical protein
VATLFQHGLAGLLRVRQHGGVHVDHNLVPLAWGAGVELVVSASKAIASACCWARVGGSAAGSTASGTGPTARRRW